MTRVFQVKKPTFDETRHNWPADYELVAELETSNLEQAYALTNTIEWPWWENKGVNVIKRARSTSVGDLIEIDGSFWLCGMAGWLKR